MDWIHCINCAQRPTSTNHRYFVISSCGKIYCSQQCVSKANVQNCRACTKCQTILINQAPPDVQEYFSDVEELMQKCEQIQAYQSLQKKSLLNTIVKKYSDLKVEYKKLWSTCGDLQKDNKCLREMLNKLYQEKSPQVGAQHQPKFINFPTRYGNTIPTNENFRIPVTDSTARRSVHSLPKLLSNQMYRSKPSPATLESTPAGPANSVYSDTSSKNRSVARGEYDLLSKWSLLNGFKKH